MGLLIAPIAPRERRRDVQRTCKALCLLDVVWFSLCTLWKCSPFFIFPYNSIIYSLFSFLICFCLPLIFSKLAMGEVSPRIDRVLGINNRYFSMGRLRQFLTFYLVFMVISWYSFSMSILCMEKTTPSLQTVQLFIFGLEWTFASWMACGHVFPRFAQVMRSLKGIGEISSVILTLFGIAAILLWFYEGGVPAFLGLCFILTTFAFGIVVNSN